MKGPDLEFQTSKKMILESTLANKIGFEVWEDKTKNKKEYQEDDEECQEIEV